MSNPIPAEGLATYLACPRQYEFEFVATLAGDRRGNREEFRALLREAICTGLALGVSSGEEPRRVAQAALDSKWDAYATEIGYHSDTQVTTEKMRAEAAITAYFDDFGEDHLDGIAEADELCDGDVIGPDVKLTAPVNGWELAVDVDYITVDSGRLLGVRLTDNTVDSRIPWENKTEVVTDHMRNAEYRPRMVGKVFGARVAEVALNGFDDGGDGAELMYLSLLETTYETDTGCEAVIDPRSMRPFLDDSREDIDEAIDWVCSNITDDEYRPDVVFDEQDFWNGSFELVVENECRYCAYSAGCQDIIRREVQFNA